MQPLIPLLLQNIQLPAQVMIQTQVRIILSAKLANTLVITLNFNLSAVTVVAITVAGVIGLVIVFALVLVALVVKKKCSCGPCRCVPGVCLYILYLLCLRCREKIITIASGRPLWSWKSFLSGSRGCLILDWPRSLEACVGTSLSC